MYCEKHQATKYFKTCVLDFHTVFKLNTLYYLYYVCTLYLIHNWTWLLILVKEKSLKFSEKNQGYCLGKKRIFLSKDSLRFES